MEFTLRWSQIFQRRKVNFILESCWKWQYKKFKHPSTI